MECRALAEVKQERYGTISDVFRRTLGVIGFSAAESPPISCHHPKLNNAAFPPVATVFHVTARSTAKRGR